MAEHIAVNDGVVGSNPTSGAREKTAILRSFLVLELPIDFAVYRWFSVN